MITSLTENWLAVSVTRADIENGDRGNITTCAVAKAVRRKLGIQDVKVYGKNVVVHAQGKKYATYLPKKVSTFISAFDAKKNVAPINFSIRFNRKW